MSIENLDWQAILNSWSDEDLRYLRGIIDEKLRHRPKRKALIRGEDTGHDTA